MNINTYVTKLLMLAILLRTVSGRLLAGTITTDGLGEY